MPESTDEKKPIKKLTLEIFDEEAVAKAHPGVMETRPYVNRQKLYPIAKALFDVGEQVPGVRAFYAHEQEVSAEGQPLMTATHLSLQEKGDPGAGIIENLSQPAGSVSVGVDLATGAAEVTAGANPYNKDLPAFFHRKTPAGKPAAPKPGDPAYLSV